MQRITGVTLPLIFKTTALGIDPINRNGDRETLKGKEGMDREAARRILKVWRQLERAKLENFHRHFDVF